MGIGSPTTGDGRQVYVFKVKDGVWTWTCDDRKCAERTKYEVAANWEFYAANRWDWAPSFEEMLASEKLQKTLENQGLESPRMI